VELSKSHFPKAERKLSLVISSPPPHAESLLSVTCQVAKCRKYCFLPYLCTKTPLRCKSHQGSSTQPKGAEMLLRGLPLSNTNSSKLNQLLTAWPDQKLAYFESSVLISEATINYALAAVCAIFSSK